MGGETWPESIGRLDNLAMPDPDSPERLDDVRFNALEDEVDRLAAVQQSSELSAEEPESERFDPAHSERDFATLVRSAVDDLPVEFQRALDGVAITISDRGQEEHAYGLYYGRQLGGELRLSQPVSHALPDQIVIFRDTLLRDYGHDLKLLRSQITQTVRHEVGHRLGFDERGVRDLGL